jgi:ABC-type bacteriocin/lantibiotic exporter with double-glycine peptidase domain
LYADPNCSTSELQWAIDISGLGPVIDRLPKGLETFLGPSGGSLSGGEQQRVAIARALLQRPEVLLLDEATSALDVPTERHIFLSLKSAFSGKTLILISHRISAITWVDRFVVLQQGKIVVTGDHTILSAESAIYRSMLGAHDHDIAIHCPSLGGLKPSP